MAYNGRSERWSLTTQVVGETYSAITHRRIPEFDLGHVDTIFPLVLSRCTWRVHSHGLTVSNDVQRE